MQFCRITWINKLNGAVGYGEWYPISKEKFLREWLEQLSSTDPYFTHQFQVIEAENVKDSPKTAPQTSISYG